MSRDTDLIDSLKFAMLTRDKFGMKMQARPVVRTVTIDQTRSNSTWKWERDHDHTDWVLYHAYDGFKSPIINVSARVMLLNGVTDPLQLPGVMHKITEALKKLGIVDDLKKLSAGEGFDSAMGAFEPGDKVIDRKNPKRWGMVETATGLTVAVDWYRGGEYRGASEGAQIHSGDQLRLLSDWAQSEEGKKAIKCVPCMDTQFEDADPTGKTCPECSKRVDYEETDNDFAARRRRLKAEANRGKTPHKAPAGRSIAPGDVVSHTGGHIPGKWLVVGTTKARGAPMLKVRAIPQKGPRPTSATFSVGEVERKGMIHETCSGTGCGRCLEEGWLPDGEHDLLRVHAGTATTGAMEGEEVLVDMTENLAPASNALAPKVTKRVIAASLINDKEVVLIRPSDNKAIPGQALLNLIREGAKTAYERRLRGDEVKKGMYVASATGGHASPSHLWGQVLETPKGNVAVTRLAPLDITDMLGNKVLREVVPCKIPHKDATYAIGCNLCKGLQYTIPWAVASSEYGTQIVASGYVNPKGSYIDVSAIVERQQLTPRKTQKFKQGDQVQIGVLPPVYVVQEADAGPGKVYLEAAGGGGRFPEETANLNMVAEATEIQIGDHAIHKGKDRVVKVIRKGPSGAVIVQEGRSQHAQDQTVVRQDMLTKARTNATGGPHSKVWQCHCGCGQFYVPIASSVINPHKPGDHVFLKKVKAGKIILNEYTPTVYEVTAINGALTHLKGKRDDGSIEKRAEGLARLVGCGQVAPPTEGMPLEHWQKVQACGLCGKAFMPAAKPKSTTKSTINPSITGHKPILSKPITAGDHVIRSQRKTGHPQVAKAQGWANTGVHWTVIDGNIGKAAGAKYEGSHTSLWPADQLTKAKVYEGRPYEGGSVLCGCGCRKAWVADHVEVARSEPDRVQEESLGEGGHGPGPASIRSTPLAREVQALYVVDDSSFAAQRRLAKMAKAGIDPETAKADLAAEAEAESEAVTRRRIPDEAYIRCNNCGRADWVNGRKDISHKGRTRSCPSCAKGTQKETAPPMGETRGSVPPPPDPGKDAPYVCRVCAGYGSSRGMCKRWVGEGRDKKQCRGLMLARGRRSV